MRRIHTRQQNRRNPIETKQIHARKRAQKHRNGKRVESEHNPLGRVATKRVEVDFEAGQKHDIQNTDLAKQVETCIVGQHVQTIGTQRHAGQNKSHNVRNARTIE